MIDLLEEFEKILTGKLPVEGLGNGFPIGLEVEEPLSDRGEVRKVVGGKDLPLDDREVDFDLIEPTGVHRGMDQQQARVLCLQARNRPLAAMSGAVVDNPEDAASFSVRGTGHYLVDQRIKRDDPVLGFATTEDACPMDIQSGQIHPSATAGVFVLNPQGRWDRHGCVECLRTLAWILVFSSAEMTNSSSLSNLPSQ